MRYYITFFMLLAFGFTAGAQGEARISIGKRGSQYSAMQLIKEKMSASLLREDPKLYVTEAGIADNTDGATYIIPNYEITVEGTAGDINGPFVVRDGNEQEVFDKMHTHLQPGAKVTYNKVVIVCRICLPPRQINAPGVMVTLE